MHDLKKLKAKNELNKEIDQLRKEINAATVQKNKLLGELHCFNGIKERILEDFKDFCKSKNIEDYHVQGAEAQALGGLLKVKVTESKPFCFINLTIDNSTYVIDTILDIPKKASSTTEEWYLSDDEELKDLRFEKYALQQELERITGDIQFLTSHRDCGDLPFIFKIVNANISTPDLDELKMYVFSSFKELLEKLIV